MKRKPVMVAATGFLDGSTGSGMVSGFRGLGWLVKKVDHDAFAGSAGSWALRVASRLTRNALQRMYEDTVWRECESLRPDVFFTVKGSGLTAALLRRIQALDTKTLMYYPDVHFDHPGVHQSGFDCYDLFVTTKSFQMQWLQQRLGTERVAYVPHGYHDEVFQPVFDTVAEEDYQFDVFYMGNHSPYKQRWLERLLELNPSIKLGVAGNRWREQKKPLKNARVSLLGEVTGISLSGFIQRSRINIGLHFGKAASGWEDLVSTRTFEIPACRGFMLHIDNQEVRGLFDVGEEIDVFRTPQDLDERVRFYLGQPRRRAEMIARAFGRAVPNYGYAHRAKEVHQQIMEARWLPGFAR